MGHRRHRYKRSTQILYKVGTLRAASAIVFSYINQHNYTDFKRISI